MSYSVSGTMITLTRGDTFSALITITDLNDNQYIPMNGDRIRFAMKNDYNDETPLLIKEIPIDTMAINIFRTMVQSSAQSIHRVEHWLRLFQMTF